MTKKEHFIKVIKGEQTGRTPVFPLLMSFAAERYGVSYRTFASNGHALAEAQLMMAERFPIDAITVCSDAFRVSADLGGLIVFPEDKPPYLTKPLITSRDDLSVFQQTVMTKPDSRMRDRVKAVEELTRAAGDKLMVLGWVDMPFAEACSLCGLQNFLCMLYEDPELAHHILAELTQIVIKFATAQIDAGAEMIGAGDAAASLLSTELYREFACPYEHQVVQSIHDNKAMVKLHICGNTAHLLDDMISTGCDLFNVDHLVDLTTAATVYTNAGKAFKGNVDPVALLLQPPGECARLARTCLEKAGARLYMLSAGCEIPAQASDENFLAFCCAVETHAQVSLCCNSKM